ncbi:MAG: histidine kinase [Lachnospiraceae bacterium]|nr:histidine kinase [Lachnospiraceae bacterium]
MYLVSEEEVLGQAQKVKSAILTICIIAILAALLCATGISRGITKEIRYLIRHMQQMKTGKWQKVLPPFPRDEIGEITRTYNQMVDDLQGVVQQLAQQMLLAEQAQYRALQAEFMELQAMVNPHFIYNAMETINARAKLTGQSEISQLCTRLGRLMRAAIQPGTRLIPLKMELQYVEAYLDIQKSIMKDRLEVFYDFEEGLEEYEIPALLLQPLAENAIIHGIEHMKDDAVIVVGVSREERFQRDCLVIRVSDNGAGMDEETMEKLDRIPQEEKVIHYGIQSVKKRIQICYGEPYGVFVESSLGHGTTFTVVIPAGRDENQLADVPGGER